MTHCDLLYNYKSQNYKTSALQKATIVSFCNAEIAEFDETKSYDREFL